MAVNEVDDILDCEGFEPLSLAVDRPAFPVATLPAVVAEYVAALAEELQVPPDLVALLVLPSFGLVIAGKVDISSADRTEPTNLFTVTALESGARKTAAKARVFAPVDALEAEMVRRTQLPRDMAKAKRDSAIDFLERELRKPKLSQGQRAALHLRLINAQALPAPRAPRLTADDITPESLVQLMSEQQGRMAAVSAEGGIFQTLAGRYSKGVANLDAVNKGWSGGESIKVDRKGGEPLYIENPLLTFAMAVQPFVVAAHTSDPDSVGTGFANRFLYGVPSSLVGYRAINPAKVSADLEARYAALFVALDQIKDRHLSLSAEAEREFSTFTESLEPRYRFGGDLVDISGWANKLAGTLLRVAAIFHSVGGSTSSTVSGQTMRQALGLAEYLIAHAKIALGQLGMVPGHVLAERIVEWLEVEGLSSFTQREVLRRFHVTIDALSPALDLLISHEYITADPVKKAAKGGPPLHSYSVNPCAFRSHN